MHFGREIPSTQVASSLIPSAIVPEWNVFLRGKAAAAVADSLVEPPSLERVRTAF
jgi:hypothetical protein